MNQERLVRGEERFAEVMGCPSPRNDEPFAREGVIGTVFAELWTRQALSPTLIADGYR